MPSDPKPPKRVKDPALLSELHDLYLFQACWACGKRRGRNLHHLSNKPRHDLEQNLAWLCGSGSSGCHGAVHGNPYVDEDGERWDRQRVMSALDSHLQTVL